MGSQSCRTTVALESLLWCTPLARAWPFCIAITELCAAPNSYIKQQPCNNFFSDLEDKFLYGTQKSKIGMGDHSVTAESQETEQSASERALIVFSQIVQREESRYTACS